MIGMDNGPSPEMWQKFEKWAKKHPQDAELMSAPDRWLKFTDAAVREAVSECAKIAEDMYKPFGWDSFYKAAGKKIASALREKYGLEG